VRVLPVVLLLCGVALAQGRRGPSPEEIDAVRAVIGDKDWGLMAEWRRRDVVHRYLRYLDAPANKQEAIRAAGLKAYLTAAGPRRRGPELPEELQAVVDRVHPELRRTAHKLAYVRLRQLRLDRNLSLLPSGERREWFERLFPEPFDRRAAQEARVEFDRNVVRAIAARLRPQVDKLSELPDAERRAAIAKLVREFTEKREARVIQAVAKSVARLQGVTPELLRGRMPPDIELALDRDEIFATPRQRELIRWALQPRECPLIDLSWMGERPEERRARRQWDRDADTLGRLELLFEAGFPRDLVLHLAAAGSDQDYVRALRHLAGPRPPRERDPEPAR